MHKPIDQPIVLTPAQLQAIMEYAVKAATEPLIARIQRNSSLKFPLQKGKFLTRCILAQPSTESHPESADEIRDHKIHDLPPVPSCFVTAHGLEEVKSAPIAEIDKIYVDLQLEVAQDWKRITRLETPVHIDRPFKCIDDLHPLMERNSFRQVTFTPGRETARRHVPSRKTATHINRRRPAVHGRQISKTQDTTLDQAD